MKKIIFISLMLLLFMFVTAQDSLACSCMANLKPLKTQVKEAYSEATAIFSGEVTDITANDEWSVIVKIKVAKSWKGKFQGEITIKTSKDSAMCGYHFEIGEKYLVYAYGSKNELSAHLCSRTAPLSSNEDIKFLNRLKGAKQKKS